jgi:hypothetical protein
MQITFTIYTISAAFFEKGKKMTMPSALNYLTYEVAREFMEQIAKDWESEDGTVEKQIWRNNDAFDSVVRFHGNDGREYMWKLTKQIITQTY